MSKPYCVDFCLSRVFLTKMFLFLDYVVMMELIVVWDAITLRVIGMCLKDSRYISVLYFFADVFYFSFYFSLSHCFSFFFSSIDIYFFLAFLLFLINFISSFLNFLNDGIQSKFITTINGIMVYKELF